MQMESFETDTAPRLFIEHGECFTYQRERALYLSYYAHFLQFSRFPVNALWVLERRCLNLYSAR